MAQYSGYDYFKNIEDKMSSTSEIVISDSENEEAEIIYLSDDSDEEMTSEDEEEQKEEVIQVEADEIDTGATIRFCNNQIQVEQLLGEGAFGKVFSVKDKSGRNLAMKVQSISNMVKTEYVKNEFKILNLIQYSGGPSWNIVGFHGVTTFENEYCMFFELMGHSLEDDLELGEVMQVGDIKKIAYQLLSAIEFIHSIEIIHTDIKPSNILYVPQTMDVKLCDFGNSTFLKTLVQSTKKYCANVFRPPEVYLEIKLNATLDLWGLGCTLAELYTGEALFPADHDQQLNCFHVELLGIPANAMEGQKYKHYFKEVDGELTLFSEEELTSCGWEMETDDRTLLPLTNLKGLTAFGINGKKNRIKSSDNDFVDLLIQLLEPDNSVRITASKARFHYFFN